MATLHLLCHFAASVRAGICGKHCIRIREFIQLTPHLSFQGQSFRYRFYHQPSSLNCFCNVVECFQITWSATWLVACIECESAQRLHFVYGTRDVPGPAYLFPQSIARQLLGLLQWYRLCGQCHPCWPTLSLAFVREHQLR